MFFKSICKCLGVTGKDLWCIDATLCITEPLWFDDARSFFFQLLFSIVFVDGVLETTLVGVKVNCSSLFFFLCMGSFLGLFLGWGAILFLKCFIFITLVMWETHTSQGNHISLY